MPTKHENWLAWTLTAIGIAGAGFAAGLHRLVWGLFWVVAAIWWILIWWYGTRNSHSDPVIWWLLVLGPPAIIGLVLRLIEGIVLAFFGGLAHMSDSPATPRDDGPVKK